MAMNKRQLDKIIRAQTSGGGFSWFRFPEDRYMTQHIVSGLGHLDVLGVKSVRQDGRTWKMVNNALEYLDRELKDDYENSRLPLKRRDQTGEKHIKPTDSLPYTRSYLKDTKVSEVQEAFDYYLGQAKKYWLNNTLSEGMLSLALHRFGDKGNARKMIKSFSERSLHSEEMGMYWKQNQGYYWYQAPIETQALMIEVYDEVAADLKAVEELKIWLLKQKQTQDWKTTKATVEACYALLRRGTDILASNQLVAINVGNIAVDPAKDGNKIEAGTGYFKTSWQAGEVTNTMGRIPISKQDEGAAWGAAYWQYLERLDKISTAETPVKLTNNSLNNKTLNKDPSLFPLQPELRWKLATSLKYE
jgi:hypothetical protein